MGLIGLLQGYLRDEYQEPIEKEDRAISLARAIFGVGSPDSEEWELQAESGREAAHEQ